MKIEFQPTTYSNEQDVMPKALPVSAEQVALGWLVEGQSKVRETLNNKGLSEDDISNLEAGDREIWR